MVIALPPAAPSETQEHGSGQRRTRLPSANPMPLSAAQEAQVLEIYHNRVKAKCAAEIKEFANCAAGRSFSVSWTCRAQFRQMNGCMVPHATVDEYDRAREDWFATRDDRRKVEEFKAGKRLEHDAYLRDWWADYADGKRKTGKDTGAGSRAAAAAAAGGGGGGGG